MSAAPVMIVAGGTGGHVFPALAVAEELRRRRIGVIWVGTRRGLEARIVPAAGIAMEWIEVRALRGRGLQGWLGAPGMLLRAVWQALRLVARYRPRVVLGMGGYVSGPGALAAWLLRRPLLIHEQNVTAGFTNRLLRRRARIVMTGFPGIFAGSAPSVWTGNPVRSEIIGVPVPRLRYAMRRDTPRLLVLGGSQGAEVFNRVIPAALARLEPAQRPLVRHQAGQRTVALAREAYRRHAVAASVSEFIDAMAEAYGWADLVVCRAGALTVAELAAAGVASVLVPFPYATDDHQTANARFLSRAGAAVLIPEHAFSAQRLSFVLSRLLGDRDRLWVMAQRARQQGRPQATVCVVRLCLEVAA
ncbi:MAG: undecaprenyldiphospho-muramoylpentapeptide beta-N-acetylglucosaminyltransferase [Nitrococcus sp.]|nr:undecaprenyldiphospho-muramoylpentapeptide beta-N-acetylglucosaminyltransferase [Nitrococcus sp.]